MWELALVKANYSNRFWIRSSIRELNASLVKHNKTLWENGDEKKTCRHKKLREARKSRSHCEKLRSKEHVWIMLCSSAALYSMYSLKVKPSTFIWFGFKLMNLSLSHADLHQYFPGSPTKWQSGFWPRRGWAHSGSCMASHTSKDLVFHSLIWTALI